MASDPRASATIIEQQDGWDEGWISVFVNERLSPKALTRARNLTIEYGTAKKRYGTSKFNAVALDTALPAQSAYWSEGLVGDKLVVTSGTKIIDLTSGTQSDIKTGLTSGQKFGFVEYRTSGTDYLYAFGESQAPLRWSGSGSMSTVSGPSVNCSFVVSHKFRLLAAKSTDPNLYFSDYGNAESWQARNSLRVLDPQDGEWTGLISRRDDVVCFGEAGVWAVTGSDPEPPGPDIGRRRITGIKAGAISRDGIAWDHKTDAIYFVSFDGLLYALEGYQVKPMSSQIKNQFRQIPFAYLSKCALCVFDDLLLCAVPYGAGATANNRIFVAHLRKPWVPWTEWTGLNVSCFALRRLANRLYMADNARAYVLLYDTSLFSDEGAAVDFDLVTAPIHRGNLFSRKRPLRAHVQCDVVSTGTFSLSSGPNETDPDSFVAAPIGSIGTDATGVAYGDLRDAATDTARNGVVSVPCNLNATADEDRGEWFRLRVRANTTKDFHLRRLVMSQQADPQPIMG